MKKTQLTKYLFFTFLIVALVSSIFIEATNCQSGTTVKVQKSLSQIVVGQSVVVSVVLTDVVNLYGVEAILKWDPLILQATNIDLRLGVESKADGVLHEAPTSPYIFIAEDNLDQNSGEYRLVATSMAPASAFSGSGNIVKITFNSIKSGNSVLDLETELSDYPEEGRDPRVSNPIQHTTIDSSILVTQNGNSQTPTTSPTTKPTNGPTTGPSPTTTNNSPTPTSQPEPDNENSNNTVVLVVVLVSILVAVAIIVLVLKRRKQTM